MMENDNSVFRNELACLTSVWTFYNKELVL
jgi:hypothetical protein